MEDIQKASEDLEHAYAKFVEACSGFAKSNSEVMAIVLSMTHMLNNNFIEHFQKIGGAK